MEVGLQRASAERSIDFVFDKDAGQVKEFTKSLAQTTGLDIAELQSQFAGFGASAKVYAVFKVLKSFLEKYDWLCSFNGSK